MEVRMIELLIAYDDLDEELGEYFEACKDYLIPIIQAEVKSGSDYSINEIDTKNCNSAYLDIKFKDFAKLPFIFIGYTHGNKDALIVDGNTFVGIDRGNQNLRNSFFYTSSCLSGANLGKELVRQGCRVFFGYDEPVVAFKNELQDLSIQCDNIGLILFLTEKITAFEAYNKMKFFFTQSSKKQLKYGDVISAGLLINTREALVFCGDKEAKLDDFVIS